MEDPSSISLTHPCIMCLFLLLPTLPTLCSSHSLLLHLVHPAPKWCYAFLLPPTEWPLHMLSKQDHLDHRYLLKGECWSSYLRCDTQPQRTAKGPLHMPVGRQTCHLRLRI